MSDLKVFYMDDIDWVAAKSKEEAHEWYKNEIGIDDDELPLDCITECDLDEEGQYIPLTEEDKITELEDEGVEEFKQEIGKTHFGDITKRYGDWYIYVPFRKAIEGENQKEPFITASTEW